MAKKLIEILLVALAFTLLALIVTFTRPAHADHHAPYDSYPHGGRPQHYSDIGNPPQFTIYEDRCNTRGCERRPRHYSGVGNPPQFTIYESRPRR